MKRNGIAPYVYILPAFLFMFVFIMLPILDSVRLSFMDWTGATKAHYIGLANFKKLFQEQDFLRALYNNLYLFVFSFIFSLCMGLFLSFVVAKHKMLNTYRFIFYLPAIVSSVTLGILFSKLLEPNFGLVNALLQKIGLDALMQNWFGDPHIAMNVIIAISVLFGNGLPVIIFTAAINNVPDDLLEYSTIEGATFWQRTFYIIFPLIKGVILAYSLLSVIGSLKAFEFFFATTGGGPGNATTVLGLLLYTKAFANFEYSYAAAIGVFMSVLILSITFIFILVTGFNKKSDIEY